MRASLIFQVKLIPIQLMDPLGGQEIDPLSARSLLFAESDIFTALPLFEG